MSGETLKRDAANIQRAGGAQKGVQQVHFVGEIVHRLVQEEADPGEDGRDLT